MINLDNSLGKLAYEAYGESVDWKNYQGLPMPAWDALSDTIRQAWEVAADEVARKVMGYPTTWLDNFDERQRQQIAFSRIYATDFHHGADGHNSMMIIAKMADILDGK